MNEWTKDKVTSIHAVKGRKEKKEKEEEEKATVKQEERLLRWASEEGPEEDRGLEGGGTRLYCQIWVPKALINAWKGRGRRGRKEKGQGWKEEEGMEEDS